MSNQKIKLFSHFATIQWANFSGFHEVVWEQDLCVCIQLYILGGIQVNLTSKVIFYPHSQEILEDKMILYRTIVPLLLIFQMIKMIGISTIKMVWFSFILTHSWFGLLLNSVKVSFKRPQEWKNHEGYQSKIQLILLLWSAAK